MKQSSTFGKTGDILANLDRNKINQEIKEKQNQYFDKSPINYKVGSFPIKSVLKVRPLFLPEKLKNPTETIEVLDMESVIFRHEQSSGLKSLTKDKLYRCSLTIPPAGHNQDLFHYCFTDIMLEVFAGLSYGIFVIGGHDAGKTFSTIGSMADPGFLFYFAKQIFAHQQEFERNARISVSFIEFSKDFKDLLAFTGSHLDIRSTPLGQFIPGLAQVEVKSYREFLVYLKIALKNNIKRDVNKDMNSLNWMGNNKLEKSHFITKITISNYSQERGGPNTNQTITKVATSEVFIVDTEPYEGTQKVGDQEVNLSMLAFDNCIRTMYEIKQGIREECHVPYDQSKFTNFFRQFIGGKHKAIIIGTISPFQEHLEQSMRTVREAAWACKCQSQSVQSIEVVSVTQDPIQNISQNNNNRRGKSQFHSRQGSAQSIQGAEHSSSVTRNQQPAGEDQSPTVRPTDLEGFNPLDWKFVKRMQCEADNIIMEVTKIMKNRILNEDDRRKYCSQLIAIMQKFSMQFEANRMKTAKLAELREPTTEIAQSLIAIDYKVVENQVKSKDIREFFLAKVVPILYNPVYDAMEKLRKTLKRKIKEIKIELDGLLLVKRSAKDFQEILFETQQLKPNHQDSLIQFSKGFSEFIVWSQSNIFKSFHSNNKTRLDKGREVVTSYIVNIFTKFMEECNIIINVNSMQDNNPVNQGFQDIMNIMTSNNNLIQLQDNNNIISGGLGQIGTGTIAGGEQQMPQLQISLINARSSFANQAANVATNTQSNNIMDNLNNSNLSGGSPKGQSTQFTTLISNQDSLVNFLKQQTNDPRRKLVIASQHQANQNKSVKKGEMNQRNKFQIQQTNPAVASVMAIRKQINNSLNVSNENSKGNRSLSQNAELEGEQQNNDSNGFIKQDNLNTHIKPAGEDDYINKLPNRSETQILHLSNSMSEPSIIAKKQSLKNQQKYLHIKRQANQSNINKKLYKISAKMTLEDSTNYINNNNVSNNNNNSINSSDPYILQQLQQQNDESIQQLSSIQQMKSPSMSQNSLHINKKDTNFLPQINSYNTTSNKNHKQSMPSLPHSRKTSLNNLLKMQVKKEEGSRPSSPDMSILNNLKLKSDFNKQFVFTYNSEKQVLSTEFTTSGLSLITQSYNTTSNKVVVQKRSKQSVLPQLISNQKQIMLQEKLKLNNQIQNSPQQLYQLQKKYLQKSPQYQMQQQQQQQLQQYQQQKQQEKEDKSETNAKGVSNQHKQPMESNPELQQIKEQENSNILSGQLNNSEEYKNQMLGQSNSFQDQQQQQENQYMLMYQLQQQQLNANSFQQQGQANMDGSSLIFGQMEKSFRKGTHNNQVASPNSLFANSLKLLQQAYKQKPVQEQK